MFKLLISKDIYVKIFLLILMKREIDRLFYSERKAIYC